MFSLLHRALARLLRRPHRLDADDPLIDDSQSRLIRAPEQPRRLDLHAGSGLRPLHGRDPPPFAERGALSRPRPRSKE